MCNIYGNHRVAAERRKNNHAHKTNVTWRTEKQFITKRRYADRLSDLIFCLQCEPLSSQSTVCIICNSCNVYVECEMMSVWNEGDIALRCVFYLLSLAQTHRNQGSRIPWANIHAYTHIHSQLRVHTYTFESIQLIWLFVWLGCIRRSFFTWFFLHIFMWIDLDRVSIEFFNNKQMIVVRIIMLWWNKECQRQLDRGKKTPHKLMEIRP